MLNIIFRMCKTRRYWVRRLSRCLVHLVGTNSRIRVESWEMSQRPQTLSTTVLWSVGRLDDNFCNLFIQTPITASIMLRHIITVCYHDQRRRRSLLLSDNDATNRMYFLLFSDIFIWGHSQSKRKKNEVCASFQFCLFCHILENLIYW